MFRTKVPSFLRTRFNSEDIGKNHLTYSSIGIPLYVFVRLSAYGGEVKMRLIQESGRDFRASNESPRSIVSSCGKIVVSTAIAVLVLAFYLPVIFYAISVLCEIPDSQLARYWIAK